MFCPECHAEFREGIIVCSDCGVELINMPENPETDEPEYLQETPEEVDEVQDEEQEILDEEPLLLLHQSRDLELMAIIKQQLEEAGIESMLQGEQAVYLNSFAEATLFVFEQDYAAASTVVEQIIAEFPEKKTDPGFYDPD